MLLTGMYKLVLGVIVATLLPQVVYSKNLVGDPTTYRMLLKDLKAGDTLSLKSGTYRHGLPINNLHGTPEHRIIITGPENGSQATFVGSRERNWNTIQIDNSSYITIQNLKLDGQGVPDIDAVNARGVTHHIKIEHLKIIGHGGSQLTVGVATRGPAWDWVIRNNVIIGAGTGMYLGSSNGTNPFIRGLIENNVILDTLGYNMQIKHQKPRPNVEGMPKNVNKTVIRHNVFSKAHNSSVSSEDTRPNLLVGHWPLTGPGKNDLYEIYGNFFYQNPSEALFQGEGNIALYNNIFVNEFGDAINVQRHKNRPHTIHIFYNTVVSRGTGIRLVHADSGYQQTVTANAIFAENPLKVGEKVLYRDNISKVLRKAGDYFNNPTYRIGVLDLYPKVGKLQGNRIDISRFAQFQDYDLDFNGNKRSGKYRGAYAGDGKNPGWHPQLSPKPSVMSATAIKVKKTSQRTDALSQNKKRNKPNYAIQQMPPDTWYEIPNSAMRQVEAKDCNHYKGPKPCFPGIWQGNFRSSHGVFYWSGGAFDTKRNRMIIWGGGHHAYYGNEVYVFDLDRFEWERLTDPSPVTDPKRCIDVLADGNPNSRHTYYDLDYIPSIDKFFTTPGYALSCEPGGQDKNTWIFDFDQKRWVNLQPETERNSKGERVQPPTYTSNAAAYDPIDDKVYAVSAEGLFSYDFKSNRWDRLNWTVFWYDRGAVVDPRRHLLVVVGAGEVVVYDIGNKNYVPQVWETKGGQFNTKWYRPGVNYDPIADRIVVWDGGAVHALNMDTKEWEHGTEAPQERFRNGTYGRFRYSPKENAYILVNDFDKNVLIYKLTEGRGVDRRDDRTREARLPERPKLSLPERPKLSLPSTRP